MSRSPFLLDVVSLRRHPGYRETLVTHGRLDSLSVTGAAVPAGAEVGIEASLEAVEGGIVVRGRVTAPWAGECRRCLAPVGGEVAADVDEVFVTDPGEDSLRIVHDQIDLEPLVREAVVLGLPLAPLCRPDCLGLCSACGADLNLGPCGCSRPAPDPRWSALDALRSDDLG